MDLIGGEASENRIEVDGLFGLIAHLVDMGLFTLVQDSLWLTFNGWVLGALVLGLNHGLFCVGCCWALILLMFVVGTGSVGWMFLLGAVMAAERNLPWGQRLRLPLGAALLVWSATIVIQGSQSLLI